MKASVQNNNNFVRANFMHGIRNKKLWIILLVVNIFAVPYAIFATSFLGAGSFLSLAVTGLALVVNMLMGIVIPFFQFEYCYNKTKVDMTYSLPLSRKQKFLSDFGSGLTLYVGGYLIQIALSYLVYIIGAITLRNNIITAIFPDYYVNRYTQAFLYLTKFLVIVLCIQIMLYTLTTLILACTGVLFEAITSTIYINILIPSTIYIVYTFCTKQLYGMDFTAIWEKMVYRTSPLGGFMFLTYGRGFLKSELFMWLLGWLISTIIFFLLAYVIMTRRRAETVGKPFVIRILYHIILVAVMLHIGFLACYTSNSLITFFALTSVFYIIIETITNRGFKKIKTSLTRYAVIIASVLVVMFTVEETNCFGAAFHIANSSSVRHVEVRYDGLYNNIFNTNVDLKSKDNINILFDVQRDMIHEYKQQKKNDAHGFLDWRVDNSYDGLDRELSAYLNFTAYGKHNISRQYHINYEQILKMVDVELSDEYIDQWINHIKSSTTWLNVMDQYGLNRKTLVYQTQEAKSPIIDMFYECLRMDLKAVSKEEYLRPKEVTKYKIEVDLGEINILSSYKYCIAFLEKYNAFVETDSKDRKTMVTNRYLEIIAPDSERKVEEGDYTTLSSNHTFACDDKVGENIKLVTKYSENLDILLKEARVQYASKKPCYMIRAYGMLYAIPQEYSDIASQVYENDAEAYPYYE